MKQKLHGIVIGILITCMIINIPTLAAVVEKQIKVQTGVNIYVNDNLLKPVDVNGNPVETFIFNGTTYLPVRAIASAFNTDIQWDGKTRSVYVGKHISDKPAVLIKDLDYFTGSKFSTRTTEKDNLSNTQTNVVTHNGNKIDNVYKINGKYTYIAGTLFQFYDFRSNYEPKILTIYGDGKLLYEREMKGGIEPIDFKVDITGVLELRIIMEGYTGGLWGPSYGISNLGLYF